MDKETCVRFHNEFTRELKELCEKYNFVISKNNMTYGDAEFSLSIKATEVNADGTMKVDASKNNIMRDALYPYMSSVPKTIIGLGFNDGKNNCVIIDWNSRARSYPFIYQAEDGKQYKASAQFIASRLSR